MTPDQALEDVRGYAKAGRITVSDHAMERAYARGANANDIQNALANATRCKYQADKDTWKVDGPDLDGDDLTLVVAIEDGIVVVTLF